MIKRRLILPAMILWTGSGLIVTGQDQPPPDPIMQQLESFGPLLNQDRPAEAERVLDQVQLRANQSKFKLGESTISTYAFSSLLLISTYLRLNDYANAERVAKDRVAWA